MRAFSVSACTAFFALLAFGALAYASESNGAIDSAYKLTKICKDETCSTYGNVNWKPTLNASTTGAAAVAITDSGLTGHLWGDEIGWINLSPTDAGVSIDAATGALSGQAYASVGSWINFNSTGEGVTINSSGEFTGYAYVSGIGGGWMKFDCSSSSTCVKTDWRPVPDRSSGADSGAGSGGGSSGGGGGGGGGIYGLITVASPSATTSVSTTTPAASAPPASVPKPPGADLPFGCVTPTGFSFITGESCSTLIEARQKPTFTGFLSIGSRGEEVSALQRVLAELDYYAYGEITGFFGPVTKAAVVAFQKAQGLTPFPGYVGPGTRAALNAHAAAGSPAMAAAAKPSAPRIRFERWLGVGSEGSDVSLLQKILTDLGYYTHGEITGFFGPVTKAAVTAFQGAEGLAPYPGTVGPATRSLLNEIAASGQAEPRTPAASAALGNAAAAASYAFTEHLTMGSKGEGVFALQRLLEKLGYYSGPITGFFGNLTRDAVIRFQCARNIDPCPGWVGPGTREALNRAREEE